MRSPAKPIAAQGSSHSTGGTLRGKAIGGAINIADAPTIWNEIHVPARLPPVKGKIYVYLSDKNPAEIEIGTGVKPSFVMPVSDISKVITIQDAVAVGGKNYPPIQRPSVHIFYYDGDDWLAYGKWEAIQARAPEDADFIEWSSKDNKMVMHLLAVLLRFGSVSGSSHRGSIAGSLRSESPLCNNITANESSGSIGPWLTASGIPTPQYRERLADELAVNSYFMDRSKKGMRFYWGRYNEVQKAIKKASAINQAGSWPIDIPSYCEEHIIEIFIGKSAWHNNYSERFNQVSQHYPDLVDWLSDESGNRNDTAVVWGVAKADYTFLDLQEFLDNDGQLIPKVAVQPPAPVIGRQKQRTHQDRRSLAMSLGTFLAVNLVLYLVFGSQSATYALIFAIALRLHHHLPLLSIILGSIALVPCVKAAPAMQPFPDIPFNHFSNFIQETFSPNVSLSTVLMVLFSMTENPELLNLHARQQFSLFEDENVIPASGWMRCLSLESCTD
ncbi:hypothetical protein CPB84DRAFT_1854215 [Gymnopilus junonius]|uniref:Uncharacterized protein n=1 Tax=Gymnopilus junonius TaxID=109634 RepID=A0A9P5TF48_GYMJU|nr:hypothetical protein CPB84DRAFT_1854215 [Gymnopilus junonius]